MCKNRLMYLTSLAGVLIFHTYYTGWFSWYLLMLTVTLPWFSLLCSLAPMLRLRISADMQARGVYRRPTGCRAWCMTAWE